MMKKKREGMFETNSSSTHSISISERCNLDQMLYPDSEGTLVIRAAEFGWEEETYNDAYTKASYLVTYLNYNNDNEKFLREVIGDFCKCNVEFICEGGYIDHQSFDYIDFVGILSSKENILNFIFNSDSVLNTDNDNH